MVLICSEISISFSLKGQLGKNENRTYFSDKERILGTKPTCFMSQTLACKIKDEICQVQGRTTVSLFDQDSRPTDDAIAGDSVADIQQSRHLQCRNYDHC